MLTQAQVLLYYTQVQRIGRTNKDRENKMNVAAQIAVRDFSAKTVRALANKGIRLIGTQLLPDMSSGMPLANAERGYVVDDNGTGRVWTHSQVRAAA